MRVEITDQMMIVAGRAHLRTMRLEDALEAAAPLIADMALERAAQVADKFAAEDRASMSRAYKQGHNAMGGVIAARAIEAEDIAATIRALKSKVTP